MGKSPTSYWIEFGDWSAAVRWRRVPPFPRIAGVTAVDEREALDMIQRGFYETDRELPPVKRVTPNVATARRALSGPHDLLEEASGQPGIWYPKPLYPDRTITDEGPRRTPYPILAKAALDEGGISSLVKQRSAVVLERIAYGAGSKNWYLIERPEQIEDLVAALAPGASVTFFLDRQIQEADVDDDTQASILAITKDYGDALVARRTDGIALEADYVAGSSELAEFLERLRPREKILFGRWGADDEGQAVVTVYLPDRDGTTRRHAY